MNKGIKIALFLGFAAGLTYFLTKKNKNSENTNESGNSESDFEIEEIPLENYTDEEIQEIKTQINAGKENILNKTAPQKPVKSYSLDEEQEIKTQIKAGRS
jgi:hypothetical protein